MNRTVLAGMFRPIANVSVAKSTLIKPSEKRISIVSFNSGSKPAINAIETSVKDSRSYMLIITRKISDIINLPP